MMFAHEALDECKVADVALHKGIVGAVFHIVKVGKIASICQLIKVDDMILGIFVYKQAHYVRAYEARSARDNDISFIGHDNSVFIFKGCRFKSLFKPL